MATENVTVRVLPGCVLRHDGEAVYAGYEVVVSEAEARALVEAGIVELVDRTRRRRRQA